MAGAFAHVDEAFGGVDVVVNAAGIMPLSDRPAGHDGPYRIYRTNIRGSFVVSQQAARRLRDWGACGAYAASKGAVEATTLIPARESRGRDVTVNAVAPGATAASHKRTLR